MCANTTMGITILCVYLSGSLYVYSDETSRGKVSKENCAARFGIKLNLSYSPRDFITTPIDTRWILPCGALTQTRNLCGNNRKVNNNDHCDYSFAINQRLIPHNYTDHHFQIESIHQPVSPVREKDALSVVY